MECCRRQNLDVNKNIINSIDLSYVLDHYLEVNLKLNKAKEKLMPSYCDFDFGKFKNITKLDFIYACNLSDHFKINFQSKSSSNLFYYP